MAPDVLTSIASSSAAVSAAYDVVRMLRHRFAFRLPGVEKGLLMEGLSNKPSPAVLEIAQRAIRDIETLEASSISDPAPEKASSYVAELEAFVSRRFSEGLESTANAAKRYWKICDRRPATEPGAAR